MKLLLGLLVWPLLWFMRVLHLGDEEMERQRRVAGILHRLREIERKRQKELAQ